MQRISHAQFRTGLICIFAKYMALLSDVCFVIFLSSRKLFRVLPATTHDFTMPFWGNHSMLRLVILCRRVECDNFHISSRLLSCESGHTDFFYLTSIPCSFNRLYSPSSLWFRRLSAISIYSSGWVEFFLNFLSCRVYYYFLDFIPQFVRFLSTNWSPL